MFTNFFSLFSIVFLLISVLYTEPKAVVFHEVGGKVGVEAEHYVKMDKTDVRKWYKITGNLRPEGDSDGSHASSASGNAYMEVLPDTRVDPNKHPLVSGENFTDNAGSMCILSYDIYFETTGTYLVWARCYSSGKEDNGVHVGIDGTWPTSGNRIQWCSGKNKWTWSSAQRTPQKHCGDPKKIKLNVNTKGIHQIQFSMREDGFELDKFVMYQNTGYTPNGADIAEKEYTGVEVVNRVSPHHTNPVQFSINKNSVKINSIAKDAKIGIYNAMGKLIRNITKSSSTIKLKAGIYFINVNQPAGKTAYKLNIQ